MQVISSWRPYDPEDHPHPRLFDSSLVVSSPDVAAAMPPMSWSRDAVAATIDLQPSDVVIAATDGFFDAVHVFGSRGLETRRFVRGAYLDEQLDPGQLAERLLMRAWHAVQDARVQPLGAVDTPFCERVRQERMEGKHPFMPEDDIAVVVSYVLQDSV